MGDLLVTVVCALGLPDRTWKVKVVRNGTHVFSVRSFEHRLSRTTFDHAPGKVRIDNPVEPLRLEVWEANRFMPDRFYGHCEVPLIGLRPFEGVLAQPVVVTALAGASTGFFGSLLSSAAANSSTSSAASLAVGSHVDAELTLNLELVSGDFSIGPSNGANNGWSAAVDGSGDFAIGDAALGGVETQACRIVAVEMTPQQLRLREAVNRGGGGGGGHHLLQPPQPQQQPHYSPARRPRPLEEPAHAAMMNHQSQGPPASVVTFDVDVADFMHFDDHELIGVQRGAVRREREAIDLIFAKKASAAPGASKAGGTSNTNKVAAVPSPLDGQREKRIGIALQFLRMPIQRIRDAIADLDDEVFSEDVVESLLSIYPTAEEETAVRKYLKAVSPDGVTPPPSAPNAPWATPLQFVAMCAVEAKMQTRLQVWLCTMRFHRSIDEVHVSANAIGYAAQRVLESEGLRAFFAVLLRLGNYLNMGSPALRDAKGFAFSDWTKAAAMPCASGSDAPTPETLHALGVAPPAANARNLFDFACAKFRVEASDLWNDVFGTHKTSVRSALLDGCKVDLAVLQAEVRELTGHLEACRAYALGIQNREDASLDGIRAFIPKAEERLVTLSEAVDGATDAVTQVAGYLVHPGGVALQSGAEVLSSLAAMCSSAKPL